MSKIQSPNGAAIKASMKHEVSRLIDDQLEQMVKIEEAGAKRNECVKAFITMVGKLDLTEEEAEGFLIIASR